MNFVDLIKLDSTFKRKLEKFFNINLENGKKYIADFNNYISINQYKERTEITACIFVVTKDLCFEKKLINIDEILVLDKLNFFEEKRNALFENF